MAGHLTTSARSRACQRIVRLYLSMVGALTLATCDGDSPVVALPTELAEGTWGADDAGVIVSPALAHVHVGCTYGDFPAPVELDADLRFSVAGEYLLQAYPVAMGPTMPAQFAGVVRGDVLTLSVAVNDTIRHQLIVLGPVTVRFGREPGLDQCPICTSPPGADPATR
jgi:hypothetical protein